MLPKIERARTPRRGAARIGGLTMLALLVVVGVASGAGFYRWQRARQGERIARDVAAAPRTPEERLELWLELAGPQLHHRLAVFGRFSAEEPWLVTHALAHAEGRTELQGLVCAELPANFARRVGMEVQLELPAPRALGHAALSGERAQRVPVLAADDPRAAAERLRALVLHLLEDMPAALERDIPGARLVILVDGERPNG